MEALSFPRLLPAIKTIFIFSPFRFFFIGTAGFKIDGRNLSVYNKRMKRGFVVFLIFFPALLFAKEFRYRFEAGSHYKARSVVREQVFLNNRHISDSEILNRFSVRVTEVFPDGSGESEARYEVAETVRLPGSPVTLYAADESGGSKSYVSRFKQDRFGRFSEDEDDLMPVVRNVPLFPERDLRPGDQWSAPGYEIHDFREAFGLSEGFRFDTQVTYLYKGETERGGLVLDEIEAVSFASYVPPVLRSGLPNRVVSQVRQTLLWDNNAGRLAVCEESFDILFLFPDGETWNFKGGAVSEIVEVLPMERQALVRDLKSKLDPSGVDIREKAEGIALTLKDLRFYPDSDRLLPGEEAKIDEIAEALKQIPGFDIKVVGHTAEAGTEEMRRELSLARAGRVAEELIGRQARAAEEILIEGKGSDEPAASNATEEGRRLNRRVEIIIVDEYNQKNGNGNN